MRTNFELQYAQNSQIPFTEYNHSKNGGIGANTQEMVFSRNPEANCKEYLQ